jgi:hypothetical protein
LGGSLYFRSQVFKDLTMAELAHGPSKFRLLSFGSFAVAGSGAAGWYLGKSLLEYDKNHWDGILYETASKKWEPAFAVAYKAQTAVTSFRGSK